MKNDEELFAQISAGQEMLREIVDGISRRYGHDLLEFCQRFLPTYSRKRLEDIVQIVCENTYLSIQTYNIDRGPQGIKLWLFTIARNKCVDELRKKENRENTSFDPSDLSMSSSGGQDEEERYSKIRLAKQAFAELADEERLIIAVGLMGWFSRPEMAELFGYGNNLGSFDRRISRIRNQMREMIGGGESGNVP